MDFPTLRTDRLLLRPHGHADFETYFAMCADPDVMRYIGPVQDREAAFRSMASTLGHWMLRGYGPWGVVEAATGQLVGRVGLYHWEAKPEVEVGYAFAKSAWGKGYAYEASHAALKFGHAFGLRGLVSVIHPENAASIRVAEKLGARYGREFVNKGERLLMYVHPDP